MRWSRRALIVVVAALVPVSAARAAELSTSDRLQDRREVAAGTRAYAIGFEDGRFYANGWHVEGEMGGIWTPPLKLADGVWFGVDGQWTGPATKFSSGTGYTRYDLPALSGLTLSRTDFAPDGRRAVLFGLTLTNPGDADKTVTVKIDAHSELLGAYPWTGSSGHPTAADNLPDTASFDGKALVFRDQGTLPSGAAHDYAALVGTAEKPTSGVVGGGFRGPQKGKVCKDGDMVAPSACDDGPAGKGKGGELRYKVTVSGGDATTLWVAVAGSDLGLADARRQLAGALKDPDARLASKIAARAKLSRWSRVTLPGDPLLQSAVEWGKQNLADLTESAKNLKVRFVDQGKAYPAPKGTVKTATWFGAGFPDYPWLFATDGEYTAFPAVALGQFETIEAHMRALRDVSDLLNGGSGKVAHETVSDGSVYYGANGDPGNTDETAKFPSAVALIWRWTGDNGFRDNLYDFAKRNLQYVANKLDADHDGWPEGLGNVERPGMGPEKLDNAVYYIRGLYDLADMARSKGDTATVSWATDLAQRGQASFDAAWWNPAFGQFADSLKDPGNEQIFQKHWIGITPMEAELTIGGHAVPGLALAAHAATGLAGRETGCYSGTRPYNLGLFHTGCGGGADGKGDLEIFSLTTAIQAVGEGNYGRLGAAQQRRYTDANAEPMFGEPAAGGQPDEQPGAMPEILPSPGFGDTDANDKNIDRCWTCRAMFMQAWGNYGTAWPVIHQQLGVRPSLGDGLLEIVPQVPDGQPSVAGKNIRLGAGSASVLAAHSGTRYTTTVSVSGVKLKALTAGTTLPAGTTVGRVRLDGRTVKQPAVRQTNRGIEVTVPVPAKGSHVVEVRSA